MGNSKSTKTESTKTESTKTESTAKESIDKKHQMKISQILHKLTVDGDATHLDIALSTIKEPIEPYYGMSLYHSFVVGSAYDTEYDVDAMFQILKKYQHFIGDIGHLNTITKTIIFHRWNKKKYDKSTQKYTDQNSYSLVYKFFSPDGQKKLNYDGFTGQDKFDDERNESEGLLNHTIKVSIIDNTTPLLFALSLCNLDNIIQVHLDKVINLLNQENNPPSYDSYTVYNSHNKT